MSYSYENGTYTYSAAGWGDQSNWGQNDIDTTVVDSDFIDSDYVKQVYDYCSNTLRDSSERHEVVSEYAWDSDDNSVCDADVEEVHSVYAWDADEVCSVYAWETEDLSDGDSEAVEASCPWVSAAKHASEADQICSVYTSEEHEDVSACDSVADENQSGCSLESKVKTVSKLVDVYPNYESDYFVLFKPAIIRGTPRTFDGKKMFKFLAPKASLRDLAEAAGKDTSSYCEHGCCTTPECQQEKIPSPVSDTDTNTDFLIIDFGDGDEEEPSYVCERGCCAGPECQRYCAVPEYDTVTAKAEDNSQVTSTPNIAMNASADALDLDSPTYCENDCCEGSECQRHSSSPADSTDCLDEDSEDAAAVDETLTEGESYFGFRMRSDKLKFCTDVRSLHGQFRKIDNDGFEFTDLVGNKINVYFYNDTLHAVQQEYTTWFNFECLPPVVANTLCAARAAINAVFGY